MLTFRWDRAARTCGCVVVEIVNGCPAVSECYGYDANVVVTVEVGSRNMVRKKNDRECNVEEKKEM